MATVAAIVDLKRNSILAVVLATIGEIAGEWFSYDGDSHRIFFMAFVAITWKPTFRNCRWAVYTWEL